MQKNPLVGSKNPLVITSPTSQNIYADLYAAGDIIRSEVAGEDAAVLGGVEGTGEKRCCASAMGGLRLPISRVRVGVGEEGAAGNSCDQVGWGVAVAGVSVSCHIRLR